MCCEAMLRNSGAACEVQRLGIRREHGHRRATKLNLDEIALSLHCITKMYK